LVAGRFWYDASSRDGQSSMRTVTASQAIRTVRSGDRVFVHGAAATPTPLLEALAERAPALSGVTVYHLHTEGPAPHLAPELASNLRHIAFFIGRNARTAIAEGRADYMPVLLSDIPRLIERREIPIDVALIHVTPPDQDGHCSLGTSIDVVPSVLAVARTVVALVNPLMPRTRGGGLVHVSRIHLAVQESFPPHTYALPAIDEIDRRIGALVADLVPDRATIQMGIGTIPDAVGIALANKRDLGIHTEVFTDAIVPLVERGVVTGAYKEIDRGKVVGTFAMGTRLLYDLIHENPTFEMQPTSYTNDTETIRRLSKMIAINSAIEMDLTGQVCADSIGTRMYSGVGGQLDFVRGATLSEGGRAIIALPSTAGTASRIVPALREGAGVVTTRAHVDTVVTEWGVAELRGKGLAERARALAAIAHPSHREVLAAAMRARRWA
jgi:4-hydroxybutyrate CoA-transferase